ncbi:polymorphic outer membrane protein middle domain-containing protein [Chlamydia caviae]|uniref:Polymorphic outer membrane protein G family protein/autotransporter, putative n=1 Tax=Chlamydia caviae (strain ATCC VR-813 / DSM 19441 / 03DC25 / GPIC) TaxID=227941 RepID=Q823X1_CHLCV|nr:polymorphic outer membrane protein middle domain-containing protein [Chlamydia caviae]AAP05033.1 polymorphic outer membrane protein G family protein/autotransporter, putative [Chlamydia caviae GPIC]
MKHPVYWFLVSSGLLASTSLSFAATVQETLNSSDSYNGNTATSAFQTKETQAGAEYTCEGNVCITYAGKGTALTKSCFTETTENLTFLGRGYSLCFDNINTTAKPAAIEVSAADKTLSISGFSLFSCSDCPPGTTGQGAIKSGGTATFENDFSVLFKKNCSTAAGGAINCKGLTLKGTSGIANFIENKSTDNGGAIEASGASSIENNSGVISFSGNTSAKHGGAIHSNSAVTIANNHRVEFSKNTTTGTADSSGGAICCKDNAAPELKFEGNAQLLFLENSSQVSGGALYSNKLTISSGGTTVFANNTVTNANPMGGAICLDTTSGECSLSADLGNIIFDGNKVITSGGNTTTKRNSIDLNTSGKFTQLRAKDGFGIYFYDPIADNGDANAALNINAPENATTYNGRVVFSGETLSATEKTEADNLKSIFKQPVTLSAGSLILKDGVTVEAKKITQTAGSAVVMDAGTTLQTPSTDGETITLPDLTINVASFGGEGGTSSPAKVHSQTANQALTVTAVSFIDDDGNGYEYPVFSKTRDFADSILLEAATGTTVTAPAIPTTPDTPSAHYGYQGNWTIAWAQGTAGTHEQKATLTWTGTGYIPNPERQAQLVPNTLWGAFTDMRALHQLMSVSATDLEQERGLWGAAITDFLQRKKTSTSKKYRHVGVGYAVGASVHMPTEDLFSLAFCQFFNNDKDFVVSKNRTHVYAGSLFFEHFHMLHPQNYLKVGSKFPPAFLANLPENVPMILNILFSYSHAENDMKTRYTKRYSPKPVTYPEVTGSWGTNCFGGEISTSFPIELSDSYMFERFVPFMKVQMIYGEQESFQEPTSEGRSFENSHLVNLALPIGVKFENISSNNKDTFDLTLVYSPDVYRSNPHCATSLVVTGAAWETKATNLARHAFVVRAANNFTYSEHIELFGHGGFELRGSAYSYNFDLGGKILF